MTERKQEVLQRLFNQELSVVEAEAELAEIEKQRLVDSSKAATGVWFSPMSAFGEIRPGVLQALCGPFRIEVESIRDETFEVRLLHESQEIFSTSEMYLLTWDMAKLWAIERVGFLTRLMADTLGDLYADFWSQPTFMTLVFPDGQTQRRKVRYRPESRSVLLYSAGDVPDQPIEAMSFEGPLAGYLTLVSKQNLPWKSESTDGVVVKIPEWFIDQDTLTAFLQKEV